MTRDKHIKRTIEIYAIINGEWHSYSTEFKYGHVFHMPSGRWEPIDSLGDFEDMNRPTHTQ